MPTSGTYSYKKIDSVEIVNSSETEVVYGTKKQHWHNKSLEFLDYESAKMSFFIFVIALI